MNPINFENKVALVTGASRGIGKAIATTLAKYGAQVAICATNLDTARETAAQIENETQRKVVPFQTNVADFNQAQDLVKNTIEQFGKIDFLVNNAGITRDGLILKMTEEAWDQVINVNLKGVFNVTKATIQHMMKARYGRIVTISSIVGIHGNAGQTNYAAAKAGIIGFTKSLAKELASRNINANVVAPGYVDTDMTAVLKEEARNAMLNAIPLKRTATPQDIANATAFFLSPMADYITGQTLEVDGGLSL
ncbi:MAG: 3-oxoacyl-[acyl-carrier-protein] reductase [Lentisphaerae bacterium]|jgi:3-oxoacyl-[acyl-carrier protein] reductase|nr:3-oxoacyl-[acyl-carrier-protein] reductase [Lentisphaerota bacterium]